MEEQIALFLFRFKRCLLPGLGELQLLQHPALYSGVNENISAPLPYVLFSENSSSDTTLTSFIAHRNKISQQSAEDHIQHFVEKVRSVQENASVEIPSAGKFIRDNNGGLQFIGQSLPKEMFPLVDAKTIIRVQDHAILVGDKESNATKMTAFYSEQNTSKRQWWKITAAILFIAAAGYLCYYFIYQQHTGGNIEKLNIGKEPATYSVP